MPISNVNGVNLYFELHGAGEPLLLVSGLGGDHSAWNALLPALVGYECLVFDNRGSGRSDKPDAPYSTRLLAEDAAALMDAIGIRMAHVAGVSMGGAIAQELALAHPDRIRSLVLASTWPRCDAFLLELMSSWASLAERNGMGATWTQALLWSFTPTFYEAFPGRVREIKDGAPRGPADVRAFVRQVAACVEHDALERLPQIQAPTMILVGDLDIYTPARFAEALHGVIRSSELVRLPDSAHAFPSEQPEVFARQLISFLSAVRKSEGGQCAAGGSRGDAA